jgi:hypothetical protein
MHFYDYIIIGLCFSIAAPRLRDDGAWRWAGCGQHDKGSGVAAFLIQSISP